MSAAASLLKQYVITCNIKHEVTSKQRKRRDIWNALWPALSLDCIFTFQETPDDVMHQFYAQIRKTHHIIIYGYVCICVPKKYDTPVSILSYAANGRYILGVYIAELSLIVLSVHFPHYKKKNHQEHDKMRGMVNDFVKMNRGISIVMGGDFNSTWTKFEGLRAMFNHIETRTYAADYPEWNMKKGRVSNDNVYTNISEMNAQRSDVNGACDCVRAKREKQPIHALTDSDHIQVGIILEL